MGATSNGQNLVLIELQIGVRGRNRDVFAELGGLGSVPVRFITIFDLRPPGRGHGRKQCCKRIFEPFFYDGAPIGTGLGLATVREDCPRTRREPSRVQSALGAGTRFRQSGLPGCLIPMSQYIRSICSPGVAGRGAWAETVLGA